MSFFSNKKKQKVSHSHRTQLMTNKMNYVIQSYVNRYNVSGYFANTNNVNVIQNIALIVTPIMQGILQKYDQNDFHRVMSKTYVDEQGRRCYGFDFISDLRNNHPWAFSIAMGVARSNKKKLNFDVNVATQLVCDIFASWNWYVYPNEKMGMHHLLWRMHRLIQNA